MEREGVSVRVAPMKTKGNSKEDICAPSTFDAH